jgi:hypothetical protein
MQLGKLTDLCLQEIVAAIEYRRETRPRARFDREAPVRGPGRLLRTVKRAGN